MEKFNKYRQKVAMLNRDMLGLGAPIDKDDQGYNKPDYNAMEILGYYPDHLMSIAHVYLINKRLLHYKKTQLKNEAAFLEEVDNYIKKLDNFKDIQIEAGEWIPPYLIGEATKQGVLLNHFKIEEEIYTLMYNHPDYMNLIKVNGKKRLLINWAKLNETIEAFKKMRYITDELEELAKKGKLDDAKDFEDGSKVNVFKVEDGYMYLSAEYNSNVVDYVRKNFKNVNINGSWYAKVPVHGSKDLLEIYKTNGFNTKAVKEVIKNTPKTEVAKERVIIKDSSRNVLSLSYPYNKILQEFINTNKSRYKLEYKGPGEYWLQVNPYDCDDLLEKFNEVNYDFSEVTAKINKIINNPKLFHVKLNFIDDEIYMIMDEMNPYVSKLKNHGFIKAKRNILSYTINNETEAYEFIKNVIKKDVNCQFVLDRDSNMWIQSMEEKNVNYDLVIPETRAFEPYDFQVEDMKAMLAKHSCLLGNDMGCGKTMESVWVGLSLPFEKLVICPPTLRLNWEAEIRNFKPDADIQIIYNDTTDIKLHEWNIIGYTSLTKHLEALKDLHFRCIMADEAHYIKAVNNYGKPTSNRAEAVLELAKVADYCIAITGTPKTSRNKDLYNILKFIKHPLGKMNFYEYGMQYCGGYSDNYGFHPDGNSKDKELNSLLKPYMIRHLKSEVLPNLKKIRQAILLDINNRAYNRYIKLIQEEKEKNIKAGKKPYDACILAMESKAKQVLAISKIKETIDFASNIIDTGESIVIATCYTEVVNKLTEKFKDNCCKIVGGMSDKDKQKSIDDFQNGVKQIMILNEQAGGVGITLTKAHIMVFNDFPWTTGELTQIEDRICRTGQKEICNIYYMISKGIEPEEKMVDILTSKSKTINAAIDDGLGDEIDIFKLMTEKSKK